MSETVHHQGKLIPIKMNGKTVEEKAKELAFDLGSKEIPSYYDSWKEVLLYDYDNEYFVYKDQIYKQEKEEQEDTEYLAKAKVNPDGTIDYTCIFYNGGTSLSECIEDALNQQLNL